MGRCPHACCYNRTNRWHVHATPPEACELCQRAVLVARKGSRLRALRQALTRVLGGATVAAVLVWLAAAVLTGGWAA